MESSLQNPSQADFTNKVGCLNLRAYTLRAIHSLPEYKQVDIYGEVIACGDPIEDETEFGITTVRLLCFKDHTGIIWIKLPARFIDRVLTIGNKLVLRSLIVRDEDGRTYLEAGLWTSVQCPSKIQITYLTL